MFKYLKVIGVMLILTSIICLTINILDEPTFKIGMIPKRTAILFIYLLLFAIKNKVSWYCGLFFNILYFGYLISAVFNNGSLYVESFTFPIYRTFLGVNDFNIGLYCLYVPIFYIPILVLSYFTLHCKREYLMVR